MDSVRPNLFFSNDPSPFHNFHSISIRPHFSFLSHRRKKREIMASLLPFLLLFLSLSLFNFLPATAAPSPAQRHLLRSLADGSGPPAADAALDLNATTFDDALRTSPTSYAIVEFFAHWCPACRNYKPQYEKVARLFNGPDAAHPGIILMTRVDCAMKANADLCDRFSVGHYPMLLWGPPAKFANAKWDPKQDKSDIQPIEDGRTSQRLLNWINKHIGSSFNLDDEKYENENLLPRNASDPGQIARAVFDVEEATAKAFEIILEHKMIKPETRAPLIKFFQLLAAHHPSKKCRMGSAELLVNFDEMWPSSHLLLNSEAATHEYGAGASDKIAVCGKEVPHGYWIFCRGSKNDTRGFSCGLWVLMHSLSVRVEDGESHLAFTAIRDFIHKFFICEECRQHFYDMCLSVKSPFESTRALSLWLWQAHNKVNERLIKEEKNLGTGDPSFPKSLWPPRQLCPTCYLSPASSEVQWNEDEVFKFLVKYYGQTLASPSTKKAATGQSQAELLTTNDSVGSAVSAEFVPVWAALGIALASVTFGALACFWRAQQKNRKYSHHLRSLKNI